MLALFFLFKPSPSSYFKTHILFGLDPWASLLVRMYCLNATWCSLFTPQKNTLSFLSLFQERILFISPVCDPDS